MFMSQLKINYPKLKTKIVQSPICCMLGQQFMNIESILKQRLICLAVIEKTDDAIPLAEALLAGGLNCIEVTFRTKAATESIKQIRKSVPRIIVGAGTLLTPDQVRQAADAGAQFCVSPGLSESVSQAADAYKLPFFPGVVTPTEIMAALDLGWKHLKFFPSETFGGVNALKALAGPFGHTGVTFIPTGGITAATLPIYLAVPQVAAVGGSWMAERKLVAEKSWCKITTLTSDAMKAIAQAQAKD
jgi:2-dehydro-3-deoxyphosphogluconate aldolase/(4S)-4-hydroxy-2-oxoglutarate aldolase